MQKSLQLRTHQGCICNFGKCLHDREFISPAFSEMTGEKLDFKADMSGPCLQVSRQQQQSRQRSLMAGHPPKMRRGGPTSGTRPPRRCSGIGPRLTPPYHDAASKAQLWGMQR